MTSSNEHRQKSFMFTLVTKKMDSTHSSVEMRGNNCVVQKGYSIDEVKREELRRRLITSAVRERL